MDLPYRKNVCVIPLIGERFLVVRKPQWPEGVFKLPQGGIEPGEDLSDAARREILEELGVRCTVLGVSTITNRYDWPHPVPPYRGQDQRFVAVRIDSSEPIVPDGSEIASYALIERETILAWNRDGPGLFSDYNGVIAAVLEEFGL
jgi:8-oxo-dGTP pyrophosphatase MutT (NUDIX family)